MKTKKFFKIMMMSFVLCASFISVINMMDVKTCLCEQINNQVSIGEEDVPL